MRCSKNVILLEDDDNIIGVNSRITITKLYVPVVTLSIIDNIEFLENIKQGFKRTVSWNKYTSEITTQPKNNNLDYMIDQTFKNLIGCFFFHLKMVTLIL